MATVQLQQGATGKAVGAVSIAGAGEFSELLVTELLPRYYENSYRGNEFAVAYASGVVAAASATATGPFAFFNPANSGKNLVLLKVFVQVVTFTAGTTGAGFGLQAVANQQPTTTTPGNTPQCTLVGSANVSVAKTFTAGTLVGAPTVPFKLFAGAYLDLAAGDISSANPIDLDGSVVIAPNSGVCIVSTGTLVANLVASFTWAEIPV